MTADDWKKELTERTSRIEAEFEGMLAHISKLDKLEGEFDQDELGAFMVIKLNKMNAKIEDLDNK